MVSVRNFELFIATRGIKKPQSTRIMERAVAVAQGGVISGGEIDQILGHPDLARMFSYDFHQGDPQLMLAHWKVAMADIGESDTCEPVINLIVSSPQA